MTTMSGISAVSDARVKAGGQALADGVLMRTERAWAIARADGSVVTGRVPAARTRIPVLRVIFSLGGALKLGVVRGMLGGRRHTGESRRARRANQRFLVAMVVAEAAVWGLNKVVPAGPAWFSVVMTLVPFALVLALVRSMTPRSLWRYHGAEHKAVAAHEQGIDLGDVDAVMACSRIHNRCGTNLLTLMVLLGLLLLPVHGAMQIPLFLLALGASAEIMTLAAKRPHALLSRAVLAPGRWVQRHVTTAEPLRHEQVLGCRALEAALAEHAIAVEATSITVAGAIAVEAATPAA